MHYRVVYLSLSWTMCNWVWFPHYPIWEPFVLVVVRLITVHSTDHTSCLLKFFCYIIVSAQEHQHIFPPHCSPGLISLFTVEQSEFWAWRIYILIVDFVQRPLFLGGLCRELYGPDGCCKSPSPKRNTSVSLLANSLWVWQKIFRFYISEFTVLGFQLKYRGCKVASVLFWKLQGITEDR